VTQYTITGFRTPAERKLCNGIVAKTPEHFPVTFCGSDKPDCDWTPQIHCLDSRFPIRLVCYSILAAWAGVVI